MNIPFANGRYILCSDKFCFWIDEMKKPDPKKSKTGQPYRTRMSGYYNTLDGLLCSFLEKRLGDCEAETFQQLQKELNDTKKTIRKLVKDLKLEAK